MILMERDERVLEYLFKRKVASIYQIMEHTKLHNQRSHLNTRLNTLEEYGYVKSSWYEGKKVYFLGEKRIKWLQDVEALDRAYSATYIGFNPLQAKHDYLLNDVYERFENVSIVRLLKTHNELFNEVNDWQHPQNLPDGLIYLDLLTATLPWAIELELTYKKKDRYKMIFSKYYRSRDIVGVLYLVSNASEMRRLKAIDKSVCLDPSSMMFFATIDDFFANPVTCVFTSSDGQRFSFDWNIKQKEKLGQEGGQKLESLSDSCLNPLK